MKNALFLPILCAGLLVSAPLHAATTGTEDPNAALRKLRGVNQNSALAEFEKVKKINNDLAIKHFSDVLKKNPKDAAALAKRGRAYSNNKKYTEAMADYNKAIELNSRTADAYVGRAVVYFMQKDYDKSWKDVHQAEALGGQFWPSFMEALKTSSKRDK